jgi:site-specific DNA-adenine methylase
MPDSHTFIDVFCGGCAVTHAALLSDKFQRFIVNDIDRSLPIMFHKALNGEYSKENRWIGRDLFFKLKREDPFIALCWSFGNIKRTYIYSREIEHIKKACYYAIMYDDFSLVKQLVPKSYDSLLRSVSGVSDINTRRLSFCKEVREQVNSNMNESVILKSMSRVENLEILNRLRNIENKSLVNKLELFGLDYRELVIPDGSVVYCDPPYESCEQRIYGKFDYSSFYDWCVDISKRSKVFVSEYSITDHRFKLVSEYNRKSKMSGKSSCLRTEKLYTI